MKAVYSSVELRNIDAALPIEIWDKVDNYLTVMNYNDHSFGQVENMLEVAYERHIQIATQLQREYPPLQAKVKRFLVTECEFNRQWYPRLIGKTFDTPPSYARVRDTKLQIS